LKAPRDISGRELSALLKRYEYTVKRQTGSHIQLTSTIKGKPHTITIPDHTTLKVGTLHAILRDVASYLGAPKSTIASELFG